MDFPETDRARPGLAFSEKLHTWLLLGRVSNLPTVWSNCLAACWLGGWNSPGAVLALCLGGSLLYVGGMFLNDACDVTFDAEFRRERPIVAGKVSQGFAAATAAGLLGAGVILLSNIQSRTLGFAVALAIAIIVYDTTHKRISFGPLLMATCRLLLYLTAASAGLTGLTPRAVLFAIALAIYVAGLSYLARGESNGSPASRAWWQLLLLAPVIAAFAAEFSIGTLLRSIPFVACVGFGLFLTRRRVSHAVGILLAGIVSLDLLAVSSNSFGINLGFLALFAVTLLSQRYVPAS